MRCLAIVRFPTPAGLTDAALHAVLSESVPRYQGIPGLHRKYFVGNDAFSSGVYEWESRATAEAFYDDAWRQRLSAIYGAVPQVEFFDLHAVVDNDAHTLRIDR
ncbi:MAG: hypothetical protein B6D46_03305 [Polyangiaceae bacterium UTPRO1]|jgi:hypothetical protein|nr:hypothetical protein [Myxococcales bacterium]OQY68435.1 MAG: hypothetical protein B6D46_03305 [Polyangiaceae bacterium UTPRO1]